MANITVHDGEVIEKAISRFKKLVAKEGTISEYKKRQYFQKPSALKHIKNKTLKRKVLLYVLKEKKKKSY